MHDHDLKTWQRDHAYLGTRHAGNETAARAVMIITLVMMVVEIAAGIAFGSMALLADGWHMASHAAALGITAFAYWYARRHQHNAAYSFGTGKVGDLAGFSSALALAMVAGLMAWESTQRLLSPVTIDFDDATAVAVLGLAVNLVCAWLLRDSHAHHHGHDDHDEPGVPADGHDHDHGHHHDHNIRAAYVHVLADALTSVLAIAALVGGRALGWVWLDPVMGIVGAAVIARWSYGLLRETARVLLDTEPAQGLTERIKSALEAEADTKVADVHVWRLGPGHLAMMATVVTHTPRPPAHYKALLADIPGLSHATIEVETCAPDEAARDQSRERGEAAA
ncbi:MAG: CDF family Co(II)/Ni(II) efflux transporter DmeF [Rhodospirillaceae bacterium]|nr:CDF family Co(II)/Ni(II) efflux transporter DmeF [Rhodospirillaceae bacterium]